MKVIDPGHVYELEWLDGFPHAVGYVDPAYKISENRLIFVKREGPRYPGNVRHHPGTNIQEVLRALIDRVKYLDAQISHERNNIVLNSLRRAIFDLEYRAAERHQRLPQFLRYAYQAPVEIEDLPTCSKCGHIGCDGSCHA